MHRLREELTVQGLDGLLVTCRENQEYLTGFTGFRDSSRVVNCLGEVVVAQQRALIFPSTCDVPLIREEASDCFEIIEPGSQTLPDILREEKISRLGFEANEMPHNRFCGYEKALEFLELVPASGLVERLRYVKDEGELALIRQAVEIADQAFAHVCDLLHPGITELEIAIEIECSLRRQRAMKSSFDPIITSGPRTSFIHAPATDRPVQEGELLLIDFGAGYQHHYSDLTRTVVMGEPSAEQESRYQVVLKAQRQAIAAARPGVPCSEIDALARQVITDAGYGDYLIHSVGHGVGRSVHEPPWLAKGSKDVLEENMVVAIEPGFYIPGWGGIRLEEVVRITSRGPQVLTRAPKSLSLD